jgi:hypothetical protein
MELAVLLLIYTSLFVALIEKYSISFHACCLGHQRKISFPNNLFQDIHHGQRFTWIPDGYRMSDVRVVGLRYNARLTTSTSRAVVSPRGESRV